eukprot:3414675-Amphidinium_carterae.4
MNGKDMSGTDWKWEAVAVRFLLSGTSKFGRMFDRDCAHDHMPRSHSCFSNGEAELCGCP